METLGPKGWVGRDIWPKASTGSEASGMWETGVWGVSQGCALPRSTLAGAGEVFLQSWQRTSIWEDLEAFWPIRHGAPGRWWL